MSPVARLMVSVVLPYAPWLFAIVTTIEFLDYSFSWLLFIAVVESMYIPKYLKVNALGTIETLQIYRKLATLRLRFKLQPKMLTDVIKVMSERNKFARNLKKVNDQKFLYY